MNEKFPLITENDDGSVKIKLYSGEEILISKNGSLTATCPSGVRCELSETAESTIYDEDGKIAFFDATGLTYKLTPKKD